jgi:fatty acid desaturase
MCRPTTTTSPEHEQLSKADAWIKSFDVDAFTNDIRALGKKLENEQGEADVRHLNKMIAWSNICAFVGLLTMGWKVNVISVIGLSTWTFTRWTMIAHHVCHGGYDKCHPVKTRWNRFKFAVGSTWRRICDWLDWMMPEAWNVEHNNRHHYCLGEVEDPDLVEENAGFLREKNTPLLVKYLALFINISTWKWFYYAPNTYKELKLAYLRRRGQPIPDSVKPQDAITMLSFIGGNCPFYSFWELMTVVFAPYALIRFVLLPLPYYFLSMYLFNDRSMFMNSMINLVLAEILTNIHGFVAVVPNHAGDDMYRFRHGCKPFSGSFNVRQVISSVDFQTGSDICDFLHGYLNYQIEHHLWPNLSMLSYKKAQPLVKEICAKHGIPYVQENVFLRTKKTIDIMLGNASMRWFPVEYEKKYLEQDAVNEAKKMNKVKLSDRALAMAQK